MSFLHLKRKALRCWHTSGANPKSLGFHFFRVWFPDSRLCSHRFPGSAIRVSLLGSVTRTWSDYFAFLTLSLSKPLPKFLLTLVPCIEMGDLKEQLLISCLRDASRQLSPQKQQFCSESSFTSTDCLCVENPLTRRQIQQNPADVLVGANFTCSARLMTSTLEADSAVSSLPPVKASYKGVDTAKRFERAVLHG